MMVQKKLFKRTNGLKQQCCRVQQEEGHVEEVKYGLNMGQGVRMTLDARHGNIHRSGTHTNGKLKYGY
jgi:hypothetical protein